MSTVDVLNKAREVQKFVTAPDDIKLDILAKYGLMDAAVYGGAGFDLIKNNRDTFIPLLSDNVINWVMTERGKPIFSRACQTNPRIETVFSTKGNIDNLRKAIVNQLQIEEIKGFESFNNVVDGIRLFGIESTIEVDDEDIDMDEYFDVEIDFDDPDDILGQSIEDEGVPEEGDFHGTSGDSEDTRGGDNEVAGYVEKVHGGYRRQIESLLLSAWGDLYGYHADGKEIVEGFIVPGGAILGTGESIKYEGILTLNESKIDVKPNTMSNAIWEEFVSACQDFDIPIMKSISDNENEVKPFKYNPMIQRKIASGGINKDAFRQGWNSYATALLPFVAKKSKELAVIRAETGSDIETFRELSGYIISLMVVNYKDELGTQLRICCGDTSKTKAVAERLVLRLRAREKTDRSIAQGKLIVADAIHSESGLSSTLTIYQNMAGYQSVPQFMGELLCNLNEGMFRPSLDKMIIGLDLENNIVTAPFTKWLLPIIAGSRSGKGVLTLNMLLNVVGIGTPLFYLDGKPDMAALLWKLQDRHNINRAMVVDGIGYKGITDIDNKPYIAPYASVLEKAMKSEHSDQILESNYGVMIYLKAMMVILLSTRYYKDEMRMPYGDLFVVFDEMFKVMKTQMEVLMLNIETELSKCSRDDKERKEELNRIKFWVMELLQQYIGNDIGVFGAGIKAVALTQFAQATQYRVSGFTMASKFCENFLLKRAVKLFGRQEGGTGTYGVARDRGDDLKFELYNKYFHFGIGSEQGNTFNSLKTFKPLLVLNENDCMELTGDSKDGAFTADMLGRIAQYSDVNQFRQKYFDVENNRDLAESLGFEGALAQVARLTGQNWEDMLRKSLERAYDIADEALRFYGIIGVDNIESVYDYICSLEIRHLWSYNDIIRAKAKGISLGDPTGTRETSESEESIFAGFDGDEDGDDLLDFGTGDDIKEDEIDADNLGIAAGIQFGGSQRELSDEEASVMQQLELRKQQERNGQPEDIGKTQADAKPVEDITTNRDPVFQFAGDTGKETVINTESVGNVMRLNDENSIKVVMDAGNPLEKYEERLLKTMKGTDYEFAKRWNLILNSIARKINPSLITRVLIVKDEMFVNGRLIATENVVGGFANIRLEDLVDFKSLFRKFKNIREITLDMTMVERFSLEQPSLPAGFFAYSEKLIKVNILLENGQKEVVDRRDQIEKESVREAVEMARHRSQFEAVCSAKNPRIQEKSPGYQSKVWKSTKTFGGRGWQAIQHQLTKENPSFVKAAVLGTVTVGILGIGIGLHSVGRLINVFKR